MGDIIKDITSQFNKVEIIDVATELGLIVPDTMQAKAVAEQIIKVLKQKLVDAKDDFDASDLCFEMAIVAEMVDEDGNVLVQPDAPEKRKPECFGFADERDPACVKCWALSLCIPERAKLRQHCFGKKFDKNKPECNVCSENSNCQKEMEK